MDSQANENPPDPPKGYPAAATANSSRRGYLGSSWIRPFPSERPLTAHYPDEGQSGENGCDHKRRQPDLGWLPAVSKVQRWVSSLNLPDRSSKPGEEQTARDPSQVAPVVDLGYAWLLASSGGAGCEPNQEVYSPDGDDTPQGSLQTDFRGSCGSGIRVRPRQPGDRRLLQKRLQKRELPGLGHP